MSSHDPQEPAPASRGWGHTTGDGTARVVVVDDHPLFRDGLQQLLADVADIDIVGEVGSAEDAIALIGQLDAENAIDVVVMDLNLPGMSGVEATRRLTRQHPQLGVLVVTMFDDDDSVFTAMRAGARGYIVKNANPDEVIHAVRTVARGEAVFGTALARRMVDWFDPDQPRARQPFAELTGRERQVLNLVAAGLSNQVIADRLGISLKTVRNQVSNVFVKLQVQDRAQAIIRARDAGFGRA